MVTASSIMRAPTVHCIVINFILSCYLFFAVSKKVNMQSLLSQWLCFGRRLKKIQKQLNKPQTVFAFDFVEVSINLLCGPITVAGTDCFCFFLYFLGCTSAMCPERVVDSS